VDECADGTDCGKGNCVNVLGGHYCKCIEGYDNTTGICSGK